MNIKYIELIVCGIAIVMINYYGIKKTYLAIDEGNFKMVNKLSNLIAILSAILIMAALIIA